MKKNYDFSKGIKNPYAKQLKLQKEQRKEEKGDMKRKTLACLILVMELCSTMYVQDGNASAKKEKVGFAKKKIAVTAGKKVILKFNNPKSKVKWKVSKKKVVKIVKKKGSKNNVVTLRGIKKGNCVITAKKIR